MDKSRQRTVADREQSLDLDHLEVFGREAYGHARTAAAHCVVDRGRKVQVKGISVLVRLGRLLAIVARSGEHGRVVADAVLVDLPEEIGQCLLTQAADAAGRQLNTATLLLDQPGVGQRLGEVGQAVQRPSGILAHVLPDLVEIDLAEGGWGGRGLEHLLHTVELAQARGEIGGAVEAHRPLAVEVVALLPARVGERALEVLGQPLHLPTQVHVLEDRLHELAQLSLLLG